MHCHISCTVRLKIVKLHTGLIPSYQYDVAKNAEHLVDAGRFVDSLEDRGRQINRETRTSRPLYTVVLPLQQTVKRSCCIQQRNVKVKLHAKGRFPLPEFTGRVHGPCTWASGFHYPSWRPELTGVKKCTRVLGPSTRPVNSASELG